MGLAICPTCKSQVSTNASNCLHCGEYIDYEEWSIKYIKPRKIRCPRCGGYGKEKIDDGQNK